MTVFVRLLVMAIASVAVLGLAAQPAEACSCVGTFSGNPACQARWQYTEIFRGKVTSISRAEPNKERGIGSGATWIHFEVLEGFLGAGSRTYDLLNAGSSCDFVFVPGKEYLVYAHTGRVSICTPTREVEGAGDDLKYLRSIPAAPPREGRIIGMARHVEWTQPDRKDAPVAGARITVEGQGLRRSAVTSADGRYEVRVPAGEYRVRAEVAAGMYSGPLWQERVTVKDARGCGVADFTVAFNGRLNARILAGNGKPVAHLGLKLVSVETENRPGDVTAQTDELGQLRLEHIPPGRFVLGLDVPDGTSKRGVNEFFLPGLSERTSAKTISLRPSEELELGDVVIPDMLRFVTLTGVVQDSWGKPVERASVYLKPAGYPDAQIGAAIRTRADGQFSAALLEGHEYAVIVEMFTPPQGLAEAKLNVLATPDLKPIVVIPVRRQQPDPVYIPPHEPHSTGVLFALRQSPHPALAAQR